MLTLYEYENKKQNIYSFDISNISFYFHILRERIHVQRDGVYRPIQRMVPWPTPAILLSPIQILIGLLVRQGYFDLLVKLVVILLSSPPPEACIIPKICIMSAVSATTGLLRLWKIFLTLITYTSKVPT